MKKITILIMLCLTLNACGYNIAGLTKGTALKYYIEPITNDTRDTRYGDTAQNFIDRYFIKYGELTSEKNANHYLHVTLSKIKIKDDILSASDEAVTSNLEVDLQIIVTNTKGKEVFSKKYKSKTSFGISANISTSLSGRNKALTDSIENILNLFRADINAKLL